ncbi:hypothetical protein ID866_12982 [Astraeus odoratus]|nr:hypothetical protein ID866_12982 [Astraeus odoratus]
MLATQDGMVITSPNMDFAGIPFWLVCSPAYISPNMMIHKVVTITFATEIVTNNYAKNGQFPMPFQVLAKCAGSDIHHRAVHLHYSPQMDATPNPKASQGQPSSSGKAPLRMETKHPTPCQFINDQSD